MTNVSRFPFEKTIGRLSNDTKVEFLFACLDGHPNVSKKRLIIQAQSPEVGLIDGATATIMIDALGLAEF